jgi:hypothetical protein
MILNKKNKKAVEKSESIYDYEARLKQEAIEISKNFVHTKPIKYLLK